jgi:hypothetical protein
MGVSAQIEQLFVAAKGEAEVKGVESWHLCGRRQ